MAVTNTLAYYRTAVKSFIEEDPEKNKKVGDQNSGDSSNRLEHKMDLFLLRGSTLLFNNLFCPPLGATFEHCNISALEFFEHYQLWVLLVLDLGTENVCPLTRSEHC
jgi:hypothetical protein